MSWNHTPLRTHELLAPTYLRHCLSVGAQVQYNISQTLAVRVRYLEPDGFVEVPEQLWEHR